MAKATQAVLAYTAGIIDGEGCISIGKTRSQYTRKDGQRARAYYVQVSAATNDPRLADWLHGQFGGWKGHSTSFGRAGISEMYRWTVSAHRAVELLKDILPYLVLKAEQARVVLEFHIATRQYTTNPHDDYETVHEKFYQRLRELKRFRAPVETKSESIPTPTVVTLHKKRLWTDNGVLEIIEEGMKR